MIINNLHVPCVFSVPPEANAELAADANAPLALSVAFQLFQAVAGRVSQVFDGAGKVQGFQAASRSSRDVAPASAGSGQVDPSSFLIGK